MAYTGGTPAPHPNELALYGRDLWHDGRLRVGAHGDYDVVDGIENLRRAVYRRLAVSPQEYRARPQYGAGLRQLVKKPLTTSLLSEVRDRVIGQLRREARIERVVKVDVTKEITAAAVPFLKVVVHAQALGRAITFPPFTFSREG